MSWSTLSEDVWKHILVHIPLSHCLESCSRVNKALYRAAAAATQHIELVHDEAGVQRLPGLCQWMEQHGQHLTSLQLSAYDAQSGGTLTQLLCPNLRELALRHMQVQLSASSTHPGVLHSCTCLTKLVWRYCQVTDGHSSLAALSALVRLQHLNLTMVVVVSGSTDDGVLPSTVLQHLTQLTHLSLMSAGRLLSADSLQHSSCLVNLQELGLLDRNISLSPSTTPGWRRLTALREVGLQRVSFDPSILQDCTQLQELELQSVALHSLLGRLQQLQSLRLSELEYDWPVATAAYSTLTASGALRKLYVTVDDLPPGIWPHVFPSDRQLPALQELTLEWCYADEDQPLPPAVLRTVDISCLASCCPGLHRMTIDVQPDTQLSALAKASSLTRLWVSGLHAEGFASLRTLSGLVSLRHLSVYLRGPITPQDLVCLTALTRLTVLRVDPEMAPEFESAYDVCILFSQVHHLGPPVWLQLLKHCGKFRECQPLIFQGLGQRLVEQQQRHTQQGQQLAAQQQQVAELHAALSEQQHRTSELQEQLATTRAQAAAESSASQAAVASAAAEAGELRGRLQALEGQMQLLLQAMQRQGV